MHRNSTAQSARAVDLEPTTYGAGVALLRPATASSRGGRRYTHASVAVAQLEELIVEARAARHTSTVEHPAVVAARLDQFAREVEQLARQVLHHLQAGEVAA